MTDDPAGYAVNDGDGDEVSHSHPLLDMHAGCGRRLPGGAQGRRNRRRRRCRRHGCQGCLAITLVRLGLEFGAALFSGEALRPDEQAVK